MDSSSPNTVELNVWLERLQQGDLAAREELLRRTTSQMERLARKMLRAFPQVRRWAETDDVLQNSLLRLLRSLRDVKPASTREFFGLAAQQIRRELLDLARQVSGPHGLGANHASVAGDSASMAPLDPADHGQEDLSPWTEFHLAVEQLPEEEREIVGLVYYHGWTQAEAAQFLNCTVRTVQRRWQSALQSLKQRLKSDDFKG